MNYSIFQALILAFSCFIGDLLSNGQARIDVPLKYGLFAKHEGVRSITNFALFSERLSGSNYIHDLLLFNFQLTERDFCHKHFPPWYSLPVEKYHGDRQHYTFEGTDDCLFVVIFRNPYDWARSINQSPWHAAEKLCNLPFSEFIRTPWELKSPEEDWLVKMNAKFNPLVDLNPEDGSKFRNILKLRTAKIQNMLQIMKRAKNVYYLNYETVRDHPKEVIAETEALFSIKANNSFKPVELYVGGIRGGDSYKRKQFAPISQTDLDYINSQLDEKLERRIGYPLIFDPEELDSGALS